MRAVFISIGIILSASACFAQGDLVDKGQSGLFAQNTYFWGKDISGGRVQLGYHVCGWADLGLSLTNNSYSWFYEDNSGDMCLSLSGRVFVEEETTTYGVSLGVMRITGTPRQQP